ncbi:MAG: ATP-binding protein [Blastocatellia bacterium]|nr:ATP-binding protein [Blastocatellia bacterium]
MESNLSDSLINYIAKIAEYRDPLLRDYRGNPMIEALPPILSKDEFVKKVSSYPTFDETEKLLPAEIRMHCVYRLTRYFQPLDRHIILEQKLTQLIRQGYIARNPLDPKFALRLRQIGEVLSQAIQRKELPINEIVDVQSSANSYTLIGISGLGKTTAVERILRLYPQVILHGEYKGIPLNFYQVVWVKVECPHAGSLKDICGDFFKEIDDLLGTPYYKKFGDPRITEYVMLAHMCLIAIRHGVGAIVIDELQNLSLAKSGGAEAAMNFFVKMVNKIGVPVIRIGTNKVKDILQVDFRHARRSIGDYWDRFKLDNEYDMALWDFLIEELFSYQWTQEKATLTTEIKEALYDESQGIIDIGIKLYMMAQWRAILFDRDQISAEDIRLVARDGLKMVQPMIQALRLNDLKQLEKYDDIKSLDIKSYYEEYIDDIKISHTKKIEKAKKAITVSALDSLNSLIIGLVDLGITPTLAKKHAGLVWAGRDEIETMEELLGKAYKAALIDSGGTAQSPKDSSKKKPLSQIDFPNDIRQIVTKGRDQKLSAYDALKHGGFIKSPVKDFLDEKAA